MVEIGSGPSKTRYQVAFIAIGGEIVLDMVRVCSRIVLVPVAVKTFDTQGLKFQ
jgi:hypothetical protein